MQTSILQPWTSGQMDWKPLGLTLATFQREGAPAVTWADIFTLLPPGPEQKSQRWTCWRPAHHLQFAAIIFPPNKPSAAKMRRAGSGKSRHG